LKAIFFLILKKDISAYTELSALQLCRYCSCTNTNITHYLKWKKWNRNQPPL